MDWAFVLMACDKVKRDIWSCFVIWRIESIAQKWFRDLIIGYDGFFANPNANTSDSHGHESLYIFLLVVTLMISFIILLLRSHMHALQTGFETNIKPE